MTAQEALVYLEHGLGLAGSGSFKAEARTIIEHVTSEPFYRLVLDDREVSEAEEDMLEQILTKRRQKIPLQYILGFTDFYGLKIKVSPAVLIPRQETEVLVDYIIKSAKPKKLILDIGTGSGAIALAIKSRLEGSHIVASDISRAALRLAKQNAELLSLEIDFFQSDLLDNKELLALAAKADIVLANLPYLPEADKKRFPLLKHEPEQALFSGKLGLDHYSRLLSELYLVIKDGALIGLELDPRNINQAFEYASAWSKRKIVKDLLERERFLILEK